MDINNFLKQRWKSQELKKLHRKIVNSLKSGKDLKNIKDLKSVSFQGEKYLDLRGIIIKDETLNISNLRKIDFSHSLFKNVKIISTSPPAIFMDIAFCSVKFDEFELENLHCQNIYLDKSNVDNSCFSRVIFSGSNYLRYSTLNKVNFNNNNFDDSSFFHIFRTDFKECSIKGLVAKNDRFKSCLFSNCDLRDVDFRGVHLSEIVLKNCVANRCTKFDDKLKIDNSKFYSEAADTYIQIKKLFKNNSLYEESQDYYYNEMVARRKELFKNIKAKKRNFFKWLFSRLHDSLSKYGLRPLYILYWAFLCIIICTILYWTLGDICNNSNCVGSNSLSTSLYFSVVTFTTLGYGDWTPVDSISKFISSIEAMLGVFFMAFFISSIFKKIE